jgi:hypothetical protein
MGRLNSHEFSYDATEYGRRGAPRPPADG